VKHREGESENKEKEEKKRSGPIGNFSDPNSLLFSFIYNVIMIQGFIK